MKTSILCLLTMFFALGITTVNAGSSNLLNEIEDKIKEAVTHHADADGWAELNEVGKYLDDAGVKVGKLSKFAKKYKKILEQKVDASTMPPVTLIKLKDTDDD